MSSGKKSGADDISTLFLIAGVQYVYVTYLGYAALPFVARNELLLAPLLPLFGGCFACCSPIELS